MGVHKTQYVFLFAFFIVSLNITFVSSESETLWTQTNGTPGGEFGIIKINPVKPDYMYIGSGYTFYRSTDGGDSWIRVEDLHRMSETEELGVQAVVFDPFDPSTLYVGTRGGLFKSSDRGETWVHKTDHSIAHTVNEIAVDPTDTDIVYIVTTFGGPEQYFYKSVDGGDSWISYTTYLPDVYHLSSLVAVDNHKLYLGIGNLHDSNSYLYYSEDGGKNWSLKTVGQGHDTHLALIRVDPHDRDHIYVGFADNYNRGRSLPEMLFESPDGGDTWSPVQGGEVGSVVSDLYISNSNPDLIYYQSPLHRSTDGGKTWNRVHTWNYVQDFGQVEQSTLVIHPKDENILFSTLMGQGIAKSTDGGLTWWLSTNGISATFVTNLVTSPTDPDTIYASGGDCSGTWKSVDGGDSWSILNKNGITHPWVDELTIVPTEPDTLYNIADIGLIYRTEDGGDSWTEINNGFHYSSVYALAVDPVNPQRVFASNNGFGLFRTDGRGDWWGYLLGSPDYSYTIAIDPENPEIIYSGHNKKFFENSTYIFRSNDGGDSWYNVSVIEGSDAVTSISVDPGDPSRVYAGVTGPEGMLLYSDDKGDSWARLTEDFFFSTFHAQDQIAVDPHNPHILYASPWGAGLFVSEDAGDTWDSLSTPTVSISCITLDDSGDIYIADRTRPTVYRFTDESDTWSEFFDAGSGYSRLSKVKVDPENPDVVWVAAFKHNAILGGLFRIEEGVPVDVTGDLPRSVIDIEIDPSDPDTVYVSVHGENIYKTVNAGGSWDLVDMPVTGVFDIVVVSGETDTVYAASMAGRECPPELLYMDIFGQVDPENIGEAGVYKSTDAGESWVNVSPGSINSNCMALAVHPVNKAVVYVATSDGVYLTTDSGDTWVPQNTGLDFTDVGALSITDGIIYAGTRGGGVFTGLIDGSSYEVTWVPTTGPVPKISHIQVQVDPSDSDIVYASSYPGGMYKSTDRGQTWRDKNFFLPSFQVNDPLREGYYKFVIDPTDNERLYFAVYGRGVYASNDGANSQFPLFGDNGELRGATATNIAVNPQNTDQIFVSTTESVYRSNDRGASWFSLNHGLAVPDIMSLAFDMDGNIYAGSKGYGVYLLPRDAESWRSLAPVQHFGVSWHVWDRSMYLYNALLVNPFDLDIMYLGTFPTGFFRTTNRGETWHEINTNFTVDGAFAMAFHPYNKSIIFAGTYNGVSKSEDAGETWVKWDNGMPPELWVFSKVFDPLNPDIVYAAAKNGQNKGNGRDGFRGTVLKSLDGGENWFEISNGLYLDHEYYQLVMYPFNYDVLFVSATNGVYMTKNAGESWVTINNGLQVSMEVVVQSGAVNNVANNLALSSDGRYLYLGTQGRGVFKADLSLLDIDKSPDALPLSCFNFVQDGDETGVDTGGVCIPGDGEYDYGLIDKTTIQDEIEAPVSSVDDEDEPSETPIETEDEPSVEETIQETPDDQWAIPGFPALSLILALLVIMFIGDKIRVEYR